MSGHSAGHAVHGGGEGGHLPLTVLLGVLLEVTLRVVAVLLLLRDHTVRVHAELLESALQLVILFS